MANKSTFYNDYGKTPYEFVESLDSMSRLLENSQYVYSIESSDKKDELSKIFRYENLSIPQLSDQGSKIDKIIRLAVDNNIAVPISNQEYLVNTKTYIDDRIMAIGNPKSAIRDCKLWDCNNSLRFKFASLDKSYPFKYDEDEDCANQTISRIFNEQFINLEGIQYVVSSVVEGLVDKDDVVPDLINRVENTIIESFTNRYCENYYNLPIVSGICLLYDKMLEMYSGDYMRTDDTKYIFEQLILKISNTLIENGFNPNPFNIYNLCPFDAGVSNMSRTIYDIIEAEDDDQLTEALYHYSMLDRICECIGDGIFYMTPKELAESVWFNNIVNESSGGGKVGAIARTAARKANRHVNDGLRSVKSGAEHVGHAVAQVSDPIVKLVMQSNEQVSAAAQAERRKTIIQGGYTPKITRWIKRAITMVIASVAVPGGLGVLISAIALVGFLATDKSLDKLERNRVIHELEDELKIVTEKIEDSRGDENKQKKYELMRIKSSLEREILRIKTHRKKA